MRDLRIHRPALLPLHVVRRIDRVGAWLVDHGRYRVAEWMWRACRLW